jgi:hypothetical protein
VRTLTTPLEFAASPTAAARPVGRELQDGVKVVTAKCKVERLHPTADAGGHGLDRCAPRCPAGTDNAPYSVAGVASSEQVSGHVKASLVALVAEEVKLPRRRADHNGSSRTASAPALTQQTRGVNEVPTHRCAGLDRAQRTLLPDGATGRGTLLLRLVSRGRGPAGPLSARCCPVPTSFVR